MDIGVLLAWKTSILYHARPCIFIHILSHYCPILGHVWDKKWIWYPKIVHILATFRTEMGSQYLLSTLWDKKWIKMGYRFVVCPFFVPILDRYWDKKWTKIVLLSTFCPRYGIMLKWCPFIGQKVDDKWTIYIDVRILSDFWDKYGTLKISVSFGNF